MASFGIVGSGFGLYGYLPAIFNHIANNIVLPESYKEKIKVRTDLSCFLDNIKWMNSWDELFNVVDGVVIASIPMIQPTIIDTCLKFKNIQYLFVEKPLAHDIQTSKLVLQILLQSKIKFRIGYTFLYTVWYQKLIENLEEIRSSDKLLITWKFNAHHFIKNLDNWKRHDSSGGGVIKFYGIQVLAVLASLGYDQIISSIVYAKQPEEFEKWHASFRGTLLPDCEIQIDSHSLQNDFLIKTVSARQEKVYFNLSDPFELDVSLKNNPIHDRRIISLTKLCQSILTEDTSIYELYRKVLMLWEKIEKEKNKRVKFKELSESPFF